MIVHLDKRKFSIRMLVPTAFAASMGIWLLTSSGQVVMLIGGIALLILSVFLLYLFVDTLKKNPIMAIDNDGIEIYPFERGKAPWRDIEDVFVSNGVLCINYYSPEKYLPPKMQKICKVERANGFGDVKLTFQFYTHTVQDVVDCIEQFRTVPKIEESNKKADPGGSA